MVRLLLLTFILGGCAGRAIHATSDGSERDSRAADGWTGQDSPSQDQAGALAGMTWVMIKAGTFHMGSPDDEPCRLPNETLHPVTLTRSYEIGATEVTQGAFFEAVGHDPSHFSDCGSTCPVDSVDWSTAVVFCNRLSERANLQKCYSCVSDGAKYSFPYDCGVRSEFDGTKGKTIYDCPGYRLPTEAEWERAYRSGSSSAFFSGAITSCFLDNGATAIGWYSHNASEKTHQVASKAPSAWGLYDMAGNLWEWVNDWYQPDLGSAAAHDPLGPPTAQGKVLRGGSWIGSPGSMRGASRNQSLRFKALSFIGFRCARTIP